MKGMKKVASSTHTYDDCMVDDLADLIKVDREKDPPEAKNLEQAEPFVDAAAALSVINLYFD